MLTVKWNRILLFMRVRCFSKITLFVVCFSLCEVSFWECLLCEVHFLEIISPVYRSELRLCLIENAKSRLLRTRRSSWLRRMLMWRSKMRIHSAMPLFTKLTNRMKTRRWSVTGYSHMSMCSIRNTAASSRATTRDVGWANPWGYFPLNEME